jgi:hypothetical protein
LRLRQKIELDATNPGFIRSVRGFGYSFNDTPAAKQEDASATAANTTA